MKKNILWSFNPFQNDPLVLKNTVALLRSLSKQLKMAVEPVYVVSPAEVNVVLEFSIPAKDRFQAVANLECEKVLKKIKFPGLMKPKILVENNLRLSASAKALAKYAAKSNAFAIVVGTHAKKGLGRFLLGSFAETLLFHAKTPVLLVNPLMKKPRPLKKALFSSDLSEASKKAFDRFSAFLKPLKAKVLLYHLVPKPFPWAYPATEFLLGARSQSEKEYLGYVEKENTRKAEAFRKVAKKHGISCEFRLETSEENVATTLVSSYKKLAIDAIGLAAQTGRLETTLLGSTSRELLRESPIPIWVLRSP
ncbi:MAG: universal stress protein [Deltaproteobacteria bacterium]|nr:universal stress protein [Deltaproteobacteria bacterium]